MIRRLTQFQGVLPGEVLALETWLPWIGLPRGNGRIGKAPSLPRDGRLRPVDPRGAGLSLNEAHVLGRQHHAAGLGVVLRPDDQLVVADLDVPLGAQARTLLDLPGYAERSPGGGIHLWTSGALMGNRRLPGVELLAAGYVTVTGEVLPDRGCALAPLDTVLACLPNKAVCPVSPAGVRGAPLEDGQILPRLFAARNGARAHRLLIEGDWAALGHLSASEADLAAARMLRFYVQDAEKIIRILRSTALAREKWDHADYLERTVRRALDLGGPVWRNSAA
ncbi:hypothetical protein ACFP9V_18565 [Deinococcus radiopugnans]|uniref:NrS-1 polymerase-like HBD domain-containing protein n=1 Tax=Deinococcus radiopugnans ATCC 19172 TaxID=585398 RepID=A0A5C4Y8S9_9DEIO|nr:hypothetical protein [Deinococcus radiopugnans]MBB6017438.1 hypothetical protein [Deinococcus radiopugnans ATCC 19172]TNM71969.1 hypothetical protein FHR04_06290 [Deinococcus radiopugnans ATCC 19172]